MVESSVNRRGNCFRGIKIPDPECPLCFHCAYWIADKTANPPTAGHCHRYPPGIYVNPQTGTVIQKFPTTDHHHWCGEWNGDDSKLVEAAQKVAVKIAEKV